MAESKFETGHFERPWCVAFNTRTKQMAISSLKRLVSFVDENKRVLRTLDSKDEDPGFFRMPAGLTFQPGTDNLLVCDYGGFQVKMINSEDKVVAIGQDWGDKDGEFHHPEDVECTPDGKFFVSDSTNARVQLFDASGRFERKFNQQFVGSSRGISVLDQHFAPSSAGSSLVMFANHRNNVFTVWNKDVTQNIVDIPLECLYICVDLNGYVYVNSIKTVMILEPRVNFKTLKTLGSKQVDGPNHQFDGLSGMCIDSFNRLIVCDTIGDAIVFIPSQTNK